MRRITFVLSVLAIALLGVLAAGRSDLVMGAQEGTPPVEEDALAGVTFDPLAAAPSMALPNPGGLVLVRIGLEPGAVLPNDPADPSFGFVLVEAGELTIQIDGPVTVTRAGTFGPAVATAEAGGAFVAPEEAVAAGEAVVLRAGDVALAPPNVGGEIRNDGADRAVVLAFLVTPPEGEEFGGTPAAGTPAP